MNPRGPAVASHTSAVSVCPQVPQQVWRKEVVVRQQNASVPRPQRQVKKEPNGLAHKAAQQHTVKTLLIDNYDSYTYNLFQLLAGVNGAAPVVIRNDELSWRELAKQLARGRYDNVVISPGPGTPSRPLDIGICAVLLEEADDMPILGVCLGMQALATVHGGSVLPAPEPIHGRLSEVEHRGHPLFAGIPSGPGSGFEVVRYHSLAVEEISLPSCLEPIAWTCGRHHAISLQEQQPEPSTSGRGHWELNEEHLPERVLMGLQHTSRPHWGVQFHPESVATRYGEALLRNFREASCRQRAVSSSGVSSPGLHNLFATQQHSRTIDQQVQQPDPNLDVQWQVMRGALQKLGGSEAIFWHLYGRGDAADTFWLDSASQEGQRFSYMGGRGGPLWQRITFKLAAPPHLEPTVTDTSTSDQLVGITASVTSNSSGVPSAAHSPAASKTASTAISPGVVSITDATGHQQAVRSHFLDYLETRLQMLRAGTCGEAAGLPFDFTGGFVGYLGYELKAECGAPGRHMSPHPDAAMFLTDRVVAIDHATDDVYLVALHTTGDAVSSAAADAWLAATTDQLEALQKKESMPSGCTSGHPGSPSTTSHPATVREPAQVRAGAAGLLDHGSAMQPCAVERDSLAVGSIDTSATERNGDGAQSFTEGGRWEESISADALLEARRSRDGYIADIAECLEALRAGESYELCLTTRLRQKGRVVPRQLYSQLRASNPSAHAAWLSFGDGVPTICCSSPERFLRGTRGGIVEARPIKGTAPRSEDPALDEQAKAALMSSEKARAENLMIVDLLRNDLGRFCEVGSVHVSGLMEVESYATVHNLVSTVRGMRREGTSIVDCIRAAFPGGSMTGAPKLRSMQLLDRLENGPRGVYSGSLGFIGLNDMFDLNIVIRTALVSDTDVSIGAGGAIVLQSDPESEYEEMRLKACALVKAIDACVEKRLQ